MAIRLQSYNGGMASTSVRKNIRLQTYGESMRAFEPVAPFSVSGVESIRQAPEKKWGFGFIGDAAQAAFEVTKSTIKDASSKINELINVMGSDNIRLTDYAKAPGFSYYNDDGTKNKNYEKEKETRKNYFDKIDKVTSLERTSKGGSATLGLAGIGFLPFTTQMEAGKEVPILKYPVGVASYIFEQLGSIGTNSMDIAVDKMPISEKSKTTIRPFLEELGAFTAQLAGVKIAHNVGSRGLRTEKLPLSEQTRQTISRTAQITSQISMTPFSTAFGIGSRMIGEKVANRKGEITTKDAAEIVKEIKTEMPKIIEKVGMEDIKPRVGENILNLLRKEPTRKIQDIVPLEKPAERIKKIMKGEIKIEEPKAKEKAVEKKVVETTIEEQRIKRVLESEKKIAESMTGSQKDARLKAAGMEMSAIRRQLKGEPTAKEIQTATKKLESIHAGKKVDYLGQEVEATGKVSFGKHEVKFKDGTTKYVPRTDIKTKKITRIDAIKYLREQAEIKLQGKESLFGLKPIKEKTVESETKKEIAKPKKIVKKEPIKTERTKALDLSKPGGIKKKSKIGKSIEQKAIEAELTKGFKGTAEFETINIKEQAKRATDLINKDMELSRDIIRGEKPLPDNLKGTALITAMEKYIIKNPNSELAYELANSPLVSGTSAAAQELRLAAERAPDSVAARLQRIKKARTEEAQKLTKKTKKELTKEIKTETEKNNLAKEDLSWSNFLNKITC